MHEVTSQSEIYKNLRWIDMTTQKLEIDMYDVISQSEIHNT